MRIHLVIKSHRNLIKTAEQTIFVNELALLIVDVAELSVVKFYYSPRIICEEQENPKKP